MSKPAFDPVAKGYDAEFTHTLTGQFQRQRVHEVLEQLLSQQSIKRVLELSCGTGEDAIWFAQRGCQVLATDISGGMIKTAQQKVNHHQLQDQIECRQLAIQSIGSIETQTSFDLIFSNFGGFNCLSLPELDQISASFADLLKPGGHLILVVMPRFCWWETLYFLAKGQWRKAWRRQSKKPVSAALGNGMYIDTWYHSPGQLLNIFAENFHLQRVRPVGFFLPPSYLDPAFKNRKGILKALNRLEDHCPESKMLSSWSDHFLLQLCRK